MHTVGIIAEYNPFHTGHQYHIQAAKKKTGSDFSVVVMSPDFVQRGEPAVFDKFTRTRMALTGGADLVLELPVCYASGSAEYFAEGAVLLLDRLGIVDTLCFGAETDTVGPFVRAADILLHEPEQYRIFLREQQRNGMTYPRAREAALKHCCDQSAQMADDFCKAEFLSAPNNILGIEYCKALQKSGSSIRPLPIRRMGSSYHSVSLSDVYCSASAIRSRLSGSFPGGELLRHIPQECHEQFAAACSFLISSDDLLPYLIQQLLSHAEFSNILDISPDLSDRFCRLRYSCIGKTYAEIVSLLKTRQITESRIRRALIHLILNITCEDINEFRDSGTIFYARILGFRTSASPLLHEIKHTSRIPVISKTARADIQPGTPAEKMWRTDLHASHLYRSIVSAKYDVPFRTEYELSPVILRDT